MVNAYRSAPLALKVPCAACAERAKLRPSMAADVRSRGKNADIGCPFCGFAWYEPASDGGFRKRYGANVWACSGRTWFARMRGCPKVEHVHRWCPTCRGEWRELPASEVTA